LPASTAAAAKSTPARGRSGAAIPIGRGSGQLPGPSSRRSRVAAGPETDHGLRPLPAGFVPRPELVGRLVSAPDTALALITAPAGYGKSTLLAQWARCDERPFIAIAPDPCKDAKAAIVDAIGRAFEDLGWIDADVWAAVRSSAGGDASVALARLMRSLAASEAEFVLVFDDAHAIPARAFRTVVSALLGRLGRGSQVAVASRTEPPLPIGRLRAHRALVELGPGDLAMTSVQAAALLALAGIKLEFEAVQALAKQTEGWPVGLYLAGLSLRERSDVASGAGQFGGSDHMIAQYFRDELLAPLPRRTARFLRRTSVLDELSGPACNAVLEEAATSATLADLARSNLMLMPLDHNHERFRWHGMFKATLRAELRRCEPELEPLLHRRASGWLEGQGDLDGAISHAVAAGDVTRAGDLLWTNLIGYLARGLNGKVQEWLSVLRSDQIAAHAPLALAAAHSWLMTGNIDRARRCRLMAAGEVDPSRRAAQVPSIDVGGAVFDAMASGMGAVEMAHTATRTLHLESEHSPWRPYCCLLTGVAEHLAGNRELAARSLEAGIALGSASAPIVAALCLAQLVMMAIEQDDWDAAGEPAERAASIVERPALADYPISALVFAGSAATRAHEGRVDEAKRDLRHATDLLAALGDFIPWYGAEARILLARAAIGLADTVRARTLLAEASRLARRTSGAVIFQRCFEQAWAQIDTLAEATLLGPSSLTIAELRILRFLPSHRSFREIAERLGVSVNTVKTQAHAIYRKLDAASRSEAVAQASRAGLLGS
jgi:LuxR family transcriptional regulator, maltose regulon positive regulatory protein